MLNPIEFDLEESMKDISDIFEQRLKDKQIEIKIKNKSKSKLIKNDSMRLQQVLINFLSNAVKFQDNGMIKMVTQKFDNFKSILIHDQGSGIEKKKY